MPIASPQARTRWRTLLVALLTLGLLWLFFRNLEFRDIWRAMAAAHLILIVAAIAVVFVTYFLRAYRWQAILRPLGNARMRTAFRTTVIGFTASFLLPARVGEILRPYLLARQEGLKPAATFATVIVERVLDLVTVLLLFACSLPFLGVTVGSQVKTAGGMAAAGAVGAFAVLFICAGHPERLGRWITRLTGWLPAPIAHAAGRLAHVFAEGLAVMRDPGQLLVVAFWSIPLWLSIALSIWLTSRAFDLTFSYAGSFLVMMFLVVGVATPTPGGTGGFHWMYRIAVTQFFGAHADAASAAALVLHAVSFVPITILGLVFMSQDGLTLGRLRDMRETARAAEMP
jgi:glycosyltransferase 2 family protein